MFRVISAVETSICPFDHFCLLYQPFASAVAAADLHTLKPAAASTYFWDNDKRGVSDSSTNEEKRFAFEIYDPKICAFLSSSRPVIFSSLQDILLLLWLSGWHTQCTGVYIVY